MADTILLVDDEEDIREVLNFYLSDLGYSVVTASGGKQALDLVERKAPPVVLCDIKMPEMDGIEVLRRIKARSPDTEVIMITGHGDMELAVQCLQLEAADFITKPIDESVLEFSLKRAAERFCMRRQIREHTEQLEQLVADKSRQLIEAERMAAIGETVAGLSHAIKNIAGSLKGGLFVLEKGVEQDNPGYLRQGLALVRRNVANIHNLSMELLQYGKADAVRFRETDPNRPPRAVCQLMAPEAETRSIRLEADLADGLAPMVMDPDAIERCLLNLVQNALDACTVPEADEAAPPEAAGSPLTVRIESRPSPDKGVEYRVIDNGPGIAGAVREQLFQSFFTTKGMRGTGIGLMMTRKIVDRHGGHVRLDSVPGSGTCVTIHLPAAAAESKRL